MPDTRTTVRHTLATEGRLRFGALKKRTIYRDIEDNSSFAKLLQRMIRDGWIRKVSRDHNFYYELTSTRRRKIRGAWEHYTKLAGEIFRYVGTTSDVDLQLVAERIGFYALTAIVEAREIKDEDDRELWLNESVNLLSLYNSFYNNEEDYILTKEKLFKAYPSRSLDLTSIAFMRKTHLESKNAKV